MVTFRKRPLLALALAALASQGCGRPVSSRSPLEYRFPDVDHTWSLRLIGTYFRNEEASHRGRLDEEDLARVLRRYDGTGTYDDWFGTPFIWADLGAVLEVFDEDQISAVVELVEEGISDSWPTGTGGRIFGANEANIELQWEQGSRICGHWIGYRGDDYYLINQDGPRERGFQSPALTEELKRLARKYGLRTSPWSNPELDRPEVYPE